MACCLLRFETGIAKEKFYVIFKHFFGVLRNQYQFRAKKVTEYSSAYTFILTNILKQKLYPNILLTNQYKLYQQTSIALKLKNKTKSMMSKSQQQLQRNTISNFYPVQEHHRSRSRKFVKVNNAELIFNKAKELYQLGLLKQALFYFQEAIKGYVTYPGAKGAICTGELEAMYFAGTICMANGQHEKAEMYLKKLVKLKRNYKGNSLLLLSICLNKQNKIDECLTYLCQLCEKDKNIDALFYRGKLQIKNMAYREAQKDFALLVEDMKWNNIQARLYLVQSRIYCTENFSVLADQINVILEELVRVEGVQSDNLRKCRNLKAEILLLLGKVKEAEEVVNINMAHKKRDSWTLYIKSRIFDHYGQTDQRILVLNECVEVKDHKRSVIQALQALILNSMKNKDFYQAFQYSKRNSFLKIDNKATLCLFKIAQALTFLMKKKYGEALLLIGGTEIEIYRKIHGDYEFIKNLHYSALGYAYFSLGQHKDALEMFKKIDVVEGNQQHLPYLYNKRLCEGILAYQQSKIEQSIKIFESSTDFLMRSEPYFYISVILVQRNFTTNMDPDLIMRVVDIIDSGLKVSENYQMYYYRALLYFYMGMNSQAIEDVDRAVQKSEENVAKFFFLRALIFFQQRNYQSAKGELSTCISIDQKFYSAYLERAKVRLLMDQLDQAYQDLSSYPLCDQWKPLFMLYQHQFSEIIDQQIGEDWVLEIAAFQLGKYEEAGPAGKVVLAIKCDNYEEVMNLLQDALDINFQIGCLGIDDIYLLKSYCCYKLGLMDRCLEMLERSQESLKKHETGQGFAEEDQKKLLAIKVNTIFAEFCNKKLEKALELCNTLINDVYEGIVYDELSKIRAHIEKKLSGEEQNTTIQLFNGCSMISDSFVEQNIQNLKFKFLIPFPRIRVSEIQNVPYEQPLMDFTVKQIDNRAQAPWMHKGQHGVIFTNKIEVFQNLKLYTETQQNNEGSTKNRDKTSKQRMKQQLQLDAEVLNKLEKLSKNIKQSKSSSIVS